MICTLTEYYLGGQINKNEMRGMWQLSGRKKVHNKLEGKRKLERLKHSWKDHDKMDTQ